MRRIIVEFNLRFKTAITSFDWNALGVGHSWIQSQNVSARH